MRKGVHGAYGNSRKLSINKGPIYKAICDEEVSLEFELPHDKTRMDVRPAKTQISLGFRPAWSESSLSAQRVAKAELWERKK